MNIYVDVGGSEALSLKGALLVYQGKSRSFDGAVLGLSAYDGSGWIYFLDL